MEIKVPESMKKEHQALHEELKRLTAIPGGVGVAAQEVARVLHPHFQKEEEYALPPLGLLVPLSRGEPTAEMRQVLSMTDRLQKDLKEMLKEHAAVGAALEKLSQAARMENRPEALEFARALALHARNEEEVSYPASILVGKIVRMKLEK